MTTFSPPPSSESWVLQYPKQQQENKQEEKKHVKIPRAYQLEESCKNYIESAEIAVKSNKALGTDDHFKSMVCSKNLLKVCEKLMTNKESTKVTSNAESSRDDDDDFDTELSLMNEKSRMEYYRSKYGNRRNSQSLPTSPKMERKNTEVSTVGYNPYFTISKSSKGHPESSISFLTNLFGISARKPAEIQPSSSLTQNTDTNDNRNLKDSATKAVSIDTDSGLTSKQENYPKMIPQPHEYREMNFWSPTSM